MIYFIGGLEKPTSTTFISINVLISLIKPLKKSKGDRDSELIKINSPVVLNNIRIISKEEAPKVFRRPISLVRISIVKIVRPNRPKQEIIMEITAKIPISCI